MASPDNVTPELVSQAFALLFAGSATPAQTGAFLVALKAGNKGRIKLETRSSGLGLGLQ
ncbi:hypothetical protein HDU93_008688, partial [Gonapodya sp. JEL0774]